MYGIGLVALLAQGAGAVEFSTAAEVWSHALDGGSGSDGNDTAWGLGIDGDGHVVVGGTIDGAVNEGSTGVVISWDSAGIERYDLRFETGTVGATDSLDRVLGLTIDNLDQVTAVGRLPSASVADGVLWAQAIAPDGELLWERTYIDGVSPEQSAFGVSFATSNSDPFVVGWTRGDLPYLSGRWVMLRLTQAGGTDVFPPVTYDHGTESFNPDQAKAGFMDAFGGYAAVGRVGVDGGAIGSTTNDSDWAVRRYDALGTLLWEDVRGLALEDEASAVVRADDGALVVAGFQNAGTDNAEGRDDNWWVICYEPNADANGAPVIRWETVWESAPGASERATALALDPAGDVLVAGTQVDGGVTVWRGVTLSIGDGSDAGEKVWPAQPTDSVPRAIASTDDALVLAGSWGNTTDSDLYAVYLASDLDSDGTIDALDGCAEDASKIEPGICGCNFPDLDGDNDGAYDCDEICDGDPNKVDPGICGCGFPDDDDDADGVPACDDACPETDPGIEVNALGCAPGELEPVDPGDTGTGTGAEEKGCGCDQGAPTPAAVAGLLPLALLGLRRRASQPAASTSPHAPTNQSPNRA